MTRLPIPGGDISTWGPIWVDWCLATHNDDGTHKLPLVLGTGEDPPYYVSGNGKHQAVLHGTAGAPVAVGSGPSVKVSRTEAVTEASMPSGVGANNQGNAALWVASKGLAASEAQAVGLLATAINLSTQSAHNDDACAVNAQAAIQGSGTGFAMGGYFEGRRDTTTGFAYAAEFAVRNWTAADGSYNPTGVSDTSGLWIVGRATNGATKNGAAIVVGNPDSVKFDVGLAFNAQNGGSIATTSIRDDSNSVTSLLINGTHTTAIQVAATAGPVFIGNNAFGGVPKLAVRGDWTGTEGGGNMNVLRVEATAKGAWTRDHFLYNTQSMVADHASVNQKNVTGAANNGSGLIRLTVTGHGYTTGDRIIAESVGGVPNAHGSWIVTAIDANTLDLQGSTWAGTYTSGGIVTNRAGYAAYLAIVTPSVTRGGLTGANQFADDIAGVFIANNGTAKATDAIYITSTVGLSPGWDTALASDADTLYGILVHGQQGTFRGTSYGTSVIPDITQRRARGTFSAPRRALSGDLLGRLSAVGANAPDNSTASSFGTVGTARVDMYANEDQTASAQGTNMRFYTTSIGSNSAAERFRVAPADGIDFLSGTFSNYMLRLKNDVPITGRNNAGSGDLQVMKVNTSDQLEIGMPFTVAAAAANAVGLGAPPEATSRLVVKAGADDDSAIVARANSATQAVNIFTVQTSAGAELFSIGSTGNLRIMDTNFVLGTTTGTKVGTATGQKLAFWNATPIVQPSGLPAAATDLASAITLVNFLRTMALNTGLAAT